LDSARALWLMPLRTLRRETLSESVFVSSFEFRSAGFLHAFPCQPIRLTQAESQRAGGGLTWNPSWRPGLAVREFAIHLVSELRHSKLGTPSRPLFRTWIAFFCPAPHLKVTPSAEPHPPTRGNWRKTATDPPHPHARGRWVAPSRFRTKHTRMSRHRSRVGSTPVSSRNCAYTVACRADTIACAARRRDLGEEKPNRSVFYRSSPQGLPTSHIPRVCGFTTSLEPCALHSSKSPISKSSTMSA
jgi:hypothetical protein